MSNKYNGWKNYETWRVNLEFFDGVAWLESMEDCNNINTYAEALREIVLETIEHEAKGIALSYAFAFVSEVNWHEIAQSMMDNYAQESEAE